MASAPPDSANSSKERQLPLNSHGFVALLQSDSHPGRITPGYNFLISMIDKGCRRVTLLVTNCSYGVFIYAL
jgi:hypothetical protein